MGKGVNLKYDKYLAIAKRTKNRRIATKNYKKAAIEYEAVNGLGSYRCYLLRKHLIKLGESAEIAAKRISNLMTRMDKTIH